MSLQDLAERYPEEWLAKLHEFEQGFEPVDLSNETVARWFTAAPLNQPLERAAALLKELSNMAWGDLTEETWQCPICGELHEELPEDGLCATQAHLFTDEGHDGPIHSVAIHRSGVERRYIGWLYALHGMMSRGAWQEEFNWNVSVTYGRMVPVRIQKYGFQTVGVTMKWSQRRMVHQVEQTLRIAQRKVSQVTQKTRPDIIAHSFGTWLIGHTLHKFPELKIGRLILLGCALRPDFDWTTLFRRRQVEAVLNHYGTQDRVIPFGHYFVPDAGPSGSRGFDRPLDWDSDLPELESVLINQPQAGFGHSHYFREEHLEKMFDEIWRPFLAYSDLSRYPLRPDAPWPARRWKPKPWPLRAVLGGPKKTW